MASYFRRCLIAQVAVPFAKESTDMPCVDQRCSTSCQKAHSLVRAWTCRVQAGLGLEMPLCRLVFPQHSLMCAVSVIRAKILYHTLCNLISLTSHSKAIASNVSCQPTAENPQKDPLREPAARACHEVYVAVMRPS